MFSRKDLPIHNCIIFYTQKTDGMNLTWQILYIFNFYEFQFFVFLDHILLSQIAQILTQLSFLVLMSTSASFYPLLSFCIFSGFDNYRISWPLITPLKKFLPFLVMFLHTFLQVPFSSMCQGTFFFLLCNLLSMGVLSSPLRFLTKSSLYHVFFLSGCPIPFCSFFAFLLSPHLLELPYFSFWDC